MGDADIIPIGTRGRPGRGSGGSRPSAASRNLAPGTRRGPEAPDDDLAAEPGHDAGDVAPIDTAADAQADASPQQEQGAGAAAASQRMDPMPASSRGIPVGDWINAATTAARETFGEHWEPRLAEMLAFLRRRVTGEYVVDEYGFDPEITERFFLAMLRPIKDRWFRLEVRGAENIPAVGGALVVSNHSGTVPVDGLMTGAAIHDETGRFLRPLGADLVFQMPIVSELARKSGATLACSEDAERMLAGGELVGVWPEGFKGIGKPYAERYRLQRFGRGGFVAAAIRTGVPIVPVSVVGAEEIYPLVANLPSLARLLGVPYLPITPFFPLLGPLGLIPLPSKWLIEFGEPIRTDSYEPRSAEDPMLVFNVTDQVRESIQQTLYSLLMQRTSVFS